MAKKPECWPNWMESLWAKSPGVVGETPGSSPSFKSATSASLSASLAAGAAAASSYGSQSDGNVAATPAATQGESLAQHTWSVLERLSQTIRRHPTLPRDIGVPSIWNMLFWACWLHDVGKSATGFQERLRGGPSWPHRHEVLSLLFVQWLDGVLTESERQWVVAAIASHHRDADELLSMYTGPADAGDDPISELVRQLPENAIEWIWRWLAECLEAWVEALNLGDERIRAFHHFSLSRDEAIRMIHKGGAEHIRKLLRDYDRWLRALRIAREDRPLILGTIALRGFLVAADHSASARVADLPCDVLPRPDALLAKWGLGDTDLYEHQRRCLECQGNAILMAPTGGGKTEAALLWATAQSRGDMPASRLLYTLPFQASMNAMYDRLEQKGFEGQVGLEHSRSTLALYHRFLEETCDSANATRAARWHKELARLHHFPVRVLSPYQILKAPYRLPGYEALLSDLFSSVFVLDEVHAYEPQRLAMIMATVKFLRENFGARFLVMSATMPTLLMQRLTQVLGDCALIRATADFYARFQRHVLRMIDGELTEATWMDTIAHEALNGHSILVCCNTVRRAQEAFEGVRSKVGQVVDVILLHSRFNIRDRLAKERAILSATGSRSAERRPLVVVATQVVEVSLDIDLDTIYTDPAPLEALLQRFGRVNRRRLRKLAQVNVFLHPDDGQHVYEPDLVRRALGVLSEHDGRPIAEEEVSAWLDQVYQGETKTRWEKAYDDEFRLFTSSCLDRLRAFQSDKSLEDLFYQAFDSVDVLPLALAAEYDRLIEGNEPLAASELLVPMRWSQFASLRKVGKTQERGPVKVVAADYTETHGLMVG